VALPKNEPFGLALIVVIAIATIGLAAAILVPKKPAQTPEKKE
jgi:hypothetical protein